MLRLDDKVHLLNLLSGTHHQSAQAHHVRLPVVALRTTVARAAIKQLGDEPQSQYRHPLVRLPAQALEGPLAHQLQPYQLQLIWTPLPPLVVR